LFTSQLALLVAAAVVYRGLAVLRIVATVCLAAVWCHWGAMLVGDLRHWTAMATVTALPLAAVLLVARWYVARHDRLSGSENQTSPVGFGVGELLAATAIVAMAFATARTGVDTPLDRPTLSLAAVSAATSVLFVISLLSTRLKSSHALALALFTFFAGFALANAGAGSLETCCMWAALHGALLAGSLLILRAAGLRFSGNMPVRITADLGASHPLDSTGSLGTNT